jgi:hypothetical protein
MTAVSSTPASSAAAPKTNVTCLHSGASATAASNNDVLGLQCCVRAVLCHSQCCVHHSAELLSEINLAWQRERAMAPARRAAAAGRTLHLEMCSHLKSLPSSWRAQLCYSQLSHGMPVKYKVTTETDIICTHSDPDRPPRPSATP